MKKLILVLAFLLVILMSGCRAIFYKTPDGKMVGYWNFGFDTKTDDIDISRQADNSVSVKIRGLDSKTDAWQTVNNAINKIPSPSGSPTIVEVERASTRPSQ